MPVEPRRPQDARSSERKALERLPLADTWAVKAGVAAVILCTAVVSVAMTGREAAGDPAAVARSYYEAYNSKDGRTMCRLFTPS
jgi:hypothetical protein